MKPPRLLVSVMWVACALATAAGPAWPQETTSGSLAGRVLDAQNLAVPGATVTVSSGQGDRSYVTDESRPLLRAVSAARHLHRPGPAPGLPARRAAEHRPPARPATRVDARAPGRRPAGAGPGGRRRSRHRHRVDHCGRAAGKQHAEPPPGRPEVHRRALRRARRQQRRRHRHRQRLDRRRQRPREQLRHRRREHLGSRLRRRRVVLRDVQDAWQRDPVRLRPGGPGQDRRVRSRVRPVDRRHRQRGHQERDESVQGQRVRATPDRKGSSRRGPSSARRTGRSTRPVRRATEGGFTIGGPILKNRLFFFGAYNPTMERAKLVAPPGFPLASLGEVNQDRLHELRTRPRSATRRRHGTGSTRPSSAIRRTAPTVPSGPRRSRARTRRASARSTVTAGTTRPCATTAS